MDLGLRPFSELFLRCIPKYWKTKNMSNLSDMKKHEANDLNTKIFNAISNQYEDVVDKITLANGQTCIVVKVVSLSF